MRQTKPSSISYFITTCLVTLSLLLPIASAQAQNRVVVVPLFGDDGGEPPAPTGPVAPTDTSMSNYAITADTVVDNVTGLEWQRSDADTSMDWNDALDYCADLRLPDNFAGHTDWRLPDVVELQSIVDYGQASPAIEAVAFINTNSSNYWSASSDAGDSAVAWDVGFGLGDAGRVDKTNSNFVRCVRNLSVTQNAFVDNGNGTVTDITTGLIWQQQNDDVTRTHAEAITFCNNLTLGGSSNWRLPEVKELTRIVDYRVDGPAIDERVYPNTPSSVYWSASSNAINSASAWGVGFVDGNVNRGSKAGSNFVRCVR